MEVARAGPGPAVVAENSADGAVIRYPGRGAAGKTAVTGLRPSRVVVPSGQADSSADCRFPAPPGLHAELEARPGMALPEQVRQPAQARFGRSFAGVRVHADEQAGRMAAGAQAQAFTLGRHVVFGLGRYRPSTPAGAALMWHELAHVATAADTATLLRAPLYRNEDLLFEPPPKGRSEADMHAQLDAKKTMPQDITDWRIKGASPADEAYIFLEAALVQFGVRARWDSVVNLEMEIGWEKDGSTPTGLVTISIEVTGAATAELVSGVSTARSLPVADSTAKLKSDFGVDAVPGNQKWLPSELNDMVRALGLLSASDPAALAAIKGVQFKRVGELRHGDAGFFDLGGVTQGATNVGVPAIILADPAFPKHRFVRGPSGGTPLPGSVQTILHEVGHAVEGADVRSALERVNAAVDNENKKVNARNAARGQSEIAKADKALKEAHAATTAAEQAFHATYVPATETASLEADVAAKKTAYDTAHAAAITATSKGSASEMADNLAYRTAVDAFAVAIDDYVTNAKPDLGTPKNLPVTRDARDDKLAAARSARDKACAELAITKPDNPAVAAYTPVDPAQNAWADAARVLGHVRFHTLRLQKFVALVNTSGITPGLTPYAQDSWPLNAEEVYAETYSLWLTEPGFLQSNYPDLFDFFNDPVKRK